MSRRITNFSVTPHPTRPDVLITFAPLGVDGERTGGRAVLVGDRLDLILPIGAFHLDGLTQSDCDTLRAAATVLVAEADGQDVRDQWRAPVTTA